jgi:hypothetical protein
MSKAVEDNLHHPKTNFGAVPSPDTVAIMRRFLSTAVWKNAKSYEATAKHEYMVAPSKKGGDDTDFNLFAAAIRKFGYDKKFYSKTFRYCDFDGFTYWDCDPPDVPADLINRCPLDERCLPVWPELPAECEL